MPASVRSHSHLGITDGMLSCAGARSGEQGAGDDNATECLKLLAHLLQQARTKYVTQLLPTMLHTPVLPRNLAHVHTDGQTPSIVRCGGKNSCCRRRDADIPCVASFLALSHSSPHSPFCRRGDAAMATTAEQAVHRFESLVRDFKERERVAKEGVAECHSMVWMRQTHPRACSYACVHTRVFIHARARSSLLLS